VGLVDGFADVRVAQQQRHGEVGLLARDGAADGRPEGPAAEDNHLLRALQHRLPLAPLPSTLCRSRNTPCNTTRLVLNRW